MEPKAMAKRKERLTTRALDRLAKELPEGDEAWDNDLPGYHVRSRKNGLALRLSYYNAAGKRRVLTLGRYGTLTAAQARQSAIEARAVVAHGGDPRAVLEETRAEAERQQQQTLFAYLDGPYTAYQKRNKDGLATLRRIRYAFADWFERPMGSLTRADLERWQAKQEAEAKPRAFTTLQRDYGALLSLLNHAADRKVIPANPLKAVRLQKPALTEDDLAREGAERRYLEPEEAEALLAGIEAYQEEKRQQRRSSRKHGKAYLPDLDGVAYVDHVAPLILTMLYTGFRPGDLFGLRWEHVNLDFKTIRKVIEKTAHHRPEPQTFPLSAATVDVLKTWHQHLSKPKAGHVFPNPNSGKRLGKTSMRRPWARIRKLSGLPDDLALYSLRHNFASQLVMAGTDLLTVSRLMAHSDIQTTIEHYAHLAPDHKRDAVEAFASRITRPGAPDRPHLAIAPNQP